MVKLTPMSEACFQRFVAEAVEGYARDTVASGRWAETDAAANSRAELERFLPLGRETPGHHVCLIERKDPEDVVGTLWFGEITRDGRAVAYVYDIRIYPAYRRRGYAAAALAHVEAYARDRGLPAVMLHVFAHNAPAKALYEKLGFTLAGRLMAKGLAE